MVREDGARCVWENINFLLTGPIEPCYLLTKQHSEHSPERLDEHPRRMFKTYS